MLSPRMKSKTVILEAICPFYNDDDYHHDVLVAVEK